MDLIGKARCPPKYKCACQSKTHSFKHAPQAKTHRQAHHQNHH
ncbi:hypothetical protein [Moraxella lacunata]